MIKKEFLDDNFLLETKAAQELYHDHAAKMSIIDYHNHLSPKDIAENRQFTNLTEIWLEGDHYKWRAMRINGVNEKYCTGNESPEDKFMKWAETVPYTMRNPLYHWTHLELKNYFGVKKLLNADTAKGIYEECSAMLRTDGFRVQPLLTRMKAEVVCTTDDPCDTLEYHDVMANSEVIKMYPTFRPDKAYAFEDVVAFGNYIKKLSEVANVDINSLSSLLKALDSRIDYFHSKGCRSCDHGLEYIPFSELTESDASKIFVKVLSGNALSKDEINGLRGFILLHLGRAYHSKGWMQQYHVGALRNNSSRMKRTLGPDTGFDSIGDFPQAASMAKFFDALDTDNKLTKTVIYNLNPSDNELFATMIGNFNDGSFPGKIQWGSGWWFLDQKEGMEKQMNTLSNMGLLSRFIGMVTDSRSFISFPRHEYFRRILCNLIGNDIENGELPNEMKFLGKMVEDICYYNVKNYLKY
jgi:glucuronate isomerase